MGKEDLKMAKQFIDLHKDLFIIVDEHIDEINDGETILVADEDAIYECTIRIHECGNEAPLTHWREAEYVRCIRRDDLCVISLTYQDENYMMHYDMQIISNDEVEKSQQFNETVEIIR